MEINREDVAYFINSYYINVGNAGAPSDQPTSCVGDLSVEGL